MAFDYHVCGKGFIGCPGDASEFARRLGQLWDELPVSGAKPSLYHWHKHYDPFSGTASVGSQYRIERTGNPSVNPVFILFAQTIGTPVRPPPERWGKLRTWLDRNNWRFISLLGEGRYLDADEPPDGTIPLTGTMFELFDALQTEDQTHVVVYDLSRLTEPPSPDESEHQRQRAWRERLVAELAKTYTVRVPETREGFEQQALKDLKEAFGLPPLDPLYGPLPSLAAVGVDEPLLFGRGELIETLSRRIMEQGAAFTRVLGVSGAGKSSLLRAGLMGSWFNPSRGKAGLLANATAVLIEPLQLGALDPDPIRALALLLTGAFTGRDTGAVGPSPKRIAATITELPGPSGDRLVDLETARAWWDQLFITHDGPLVLILDQAEQIDAQAKREVRDRTDRDPKADPTPVLSPTWRRFVDLITSLVGVVDPILDPAPQTNEPARFRLVLGLHRESAIDLWACEKARLLANPSIEVPPLMDWRTVIQNTIEVYGLTLDEPLLASMTTEAERLTNERQPVHADEHISDDTRYDRASVLPLVKVALWRLITAWREQIDQDAKTDLHGEDKTLQFSTFAPVAGIADAVDTLGEMAIMLWVGMLSNGREVEGLFEREAFERECGRRFDHLFMGLIDVGEKGRAELNYIRRDGKLAQGEEHLLAALRATELLTGPDAEHWRLPHRTVIANWQRGHVCITGHGARLATKRRLVLAYQSGVPASNWDARDIALFIDLACNWIGNDEGADMELHDYLRSGLTVRFMPERFDFNAKELIDRLPLWVIPSDQDDWAERLFDRAMENHSRDEKGGDWTYVAATFGRHDWLGRIFASTFASKFANYVHLATGAFPLLSAARHGHADCVRMLLDRGAEPNRVHEQSGTFPLLQAVESGHADCVRILLDNGAEPNQVVNKTGKFPLLLAAENGRTDCLSLLLDKGAAPNLIHAETGAFPLLLAAQNGRADCVRMLLDKGAKPNLIHEQSGAFPLLQASQQGRADCVSLLLDKGAEPNRVNDQTGSFPLLMAAQNGYADCVILLLDAGARPNQVNERDGSFPLLAAAENGRADCVSLLLDKGAEPNRINDQTGTFPLLMAAQNADADCVRLLLDKGADANQVNDHTGSFPLLLAAQNADADCVHLLLGYGAEPTQVDERTGMFPLLTAALSGRTECVRLLLEMGAEPNRRHEHTGTFPLLLAAHQGHIACVSLLLDKGAEPNQVDDQTGTFPLLMAGQSGRADCVRVLLDKGAEPNRIHWQSGTFPLLQAAQQGHADCLSLLLNKDADPNRINDQSGTFPLLLAAQNGYADCVNLLLDHGAKPNQVQVLPPRATCLTAALHEGNWHIVRILGQMPGVLDSASPEVRAFVGHLIAHPDVQPESPKHEAPVEPSLGTHDEPASIELPVSPGRSVQRDHAPPIWETLGLAPEAIRPTSVTRVAWTLNLWGDALISVRFCLSDAPSELQALIFDLPSFERPVACVPGFDFSALANSLRNADRPLQLFGREEALLWASLLLTYQFGATPILPESPWPLVPGAILPVTGDPEQYWRKWEFTRTAAGHTVTLPFLYGGQLLRAPVLVPENGIGADLAGSPVVIMSGLDFPVPRFISFSEHASPSGLWLVREGGNE